jgi:tripartite-type tricarboxylate transporter receptor subunit TctC
MKGIQGRVATIGAGLLFLCVLAGFIFPQGAVSAAKYPGKPVTLIVPYGAGGVTDLKARVWTHYVPKYFGQPVVVENNPGAGGVAGALEVGKATPDGYMLGLFGGAFIIAKYILPVYPDMNNYEPVCHLVSDYRIMMASEKSGFKSLKDVVDFGKKNPGKLLVGINPGSGSHLDTVTMIKALKIEANYMPYKTGADRNVALAGGHIQVSADFESALKSYVDAKKVIPLGVASQKRLDFSPDIPTFGEQGFEAIDLPSWDGIFVPKGTPPDVIKTIESAFEKAARDPALLDQFKKTLVKPKFMNGTELRGIMSREDARVRELVQELGLATGKGKK